VRVAAGSHAVDELFVAGVLDSIHAGGFGGGDVLFAVVDEENAVVGDGEAGGGVVVDGRVRLGDAEAVGEGVVGEVLEPVEAAQDAGFHGVAEVGEDAGFYAGAMQLGGPVDHGLVGLGPEGVVGGEEIFELCGIEG